MCVCTHTHPNLNHIHRPKWLTLAEVRKEKLSNVVQPLDDKPSEGSLRFHSRLAVHQPPALVSLLGNSGRISCVSELIYTWVLVSSHILHQQALAVSCHFC